VTMTQIGDRGAAGEVGPPIAVRVGDPQSVGGYCVDFCVEPDHRGKNGVVTSE